MRWRWGVGVGLSLIPLGAITVAGVAEERISFEQPTDKIDAYDFVELVVRVSNPTAKNPFRDVAVTGQFQSEQGSALKVEGFCDSPDGSLYRIRFMPTKPGHYSYTVEYRQGDQRRTRSGKFIARDGQRRGLVRIDKAHPWHFVWEGTGEHYFWNGTTTYWLLGWQDEGIIRQAIDRLARLKVNRIRVALCGRTTSGDRWYEPLVVNTAKFQFRLNPWVAQRPESVENPGFDVTRYNVPFWQECERMLRYARDKNVVVSIIFYLDGADRGVDPFGKARMGYEDEQRYYRYGVARLAAFSNVMWDVTNEYHLFRDEPWTEKMGTLIKTYDPYQHLVSVHGHGDFKFRTSPWADFAMYQSWDEGGGHSFMLRQRQTQAKTGRPMPQVNEEYGYEDHYPGRWGGGRKPPARAADNRRRLAWGMYMAGGYQTTGERANRGTGRGPDTGGGWINGRGDDTMTMLEGYGHIVTCFTSLQWWKMEPRDDLVSQGNYCLAEPGQQYLVYLPNGGRVDVKLDGGGYQAQWFNPRKGQWSQIGSASGPNWKSPRSPDDGDWAIVLRRAPTDKRPTKIWNRTGPLGETPKRVTEAYPLSDQGNQGGWIKFEPMSDEFEGKELDRKKWHVGMEWWKGRQPALFSDKNVTVSDGKLHLTMRKEKLPPEAEKLGYKDYTSAALHTKARSSYGYYEVKAKPMNSAGSSSFWFQVDETPGWATEIDVFEIGGKAKGFEHKYHMTLHVTQTPQEKKHWSVGGIWEAPWRLADDYHVYGFDWGKDELKFYVDGVLVRSVENTHWHQPLYLIFDSETMPQWFGMPDDKDLPSTFSIEYVRAWKTGRPSPVATQKAWVPEPQPVRTQVLVGAHNCPLWEADQPKLWNQVLKHPERTPALGFYSQENPEVADWETKWAVEHGISFFVYCWYRNGQGGPVKMRFSSAIHDALFKSRYVGKIKFAIMWENQARGVAGVSSEADLMENLLPFWIENYLRHASYLKIDNKPLLFIYRPEFLVQDLGGVDKVRAALDKMRAACRAAGFDGLYLLGEYRGLDPKHLELMKELGLDYTFAYCWHVPGNPSPQQAIAAQLDYIDKTRRLGILPQVVTVSQGWSGWHDEGSIWKIPPTEYKELLEKAKAVIRTFPAKELGSRMLLLDNWNEWSEGHYLAPHREYGFGYLDAVREVFSDAPKQHVDLLPQDVGMGPYDQAYQRHVGTRK